MSESEQPANPYDAVPYESQAFYEAHPERLAVAATLAGLEPPALERCRVLELGCAGGGNLIPIAQTLPEAEFVGIDLSPRQVADGRALIESLGLKNVELRAMSLADAGDDLGRFDYILSHGVFSWVPAAVQEGMLAVCKRLLSPAGVAYISYNTYPGWHQRAQLREIMLFHAGAVADPAERVRRAREGVELIVRSQPDPQGLYSQVLRQEADRLRTETDTYLLHEHMEEYNLPLLFHEFEARARAHGLRYVGDARVRSLPEFQPEPVRQLLGRLTDDPVRADQYVDFLRNRTFRRSLLCHDDRPVTRPITAALLPRLRLSTMVAPGRPDLDIRSEAMEAFRGLDGTTNANVAVPLVKAALLILFEHWPRSMAFADLHARVLDRLDRPGAGPAPRFDRAPGAFADALLQTFVPGGIDLHAYEPSFVTTPGEHPQGSPFARAQAEQGRRVVNLRHRQIDLSDFDRLVLRQLDGHRDFYAILDALEEAVGRGEFTVYDGGQPLKDRLRLRQILGKSIEPSLQRLGRAMLLVG